MNILFTCSAKKWGGNEAWVFNASKILKYKHRVFLAYRKTEIGDRFQIDKFQLPFRHEGDLQTLSSLVSIIKKKQIDIVVPTKRKDYFLSGLACRITGANNIIILGIVRDLKNTITNNLVYNRLADGVMVNAQKIKDVLLESAYMHPEKIAVIPNSIAIDTASIRPASKPYPFMITSLGELSERKGFDFLIRGFALFVKQYSITDAGLAIVGSGSRMEHLRELADALDVGRMVTLTGFQKDPYPYLLSSDLFALTSKNEGIPYAVIEAALLDNAIISTKAGGIEELFRSETDCLYVNYDDEPTLARQIYELYSNTSRRRKLANNARYTAEINFSLDKMDSEMTDFFRHIMRIKA